MDDFWVKVVGVAFTLSGWGKVLYDHLSNIPKITGRLMVVITGQANIAGQNMTSFLVYPYLVNARKNVIHLLDYQLFYLEKRRWKKLHTVYGLNKVVEGFHLSLPDASEIKIPNLQGNFLLAKREPVQHGVPLHGWLQFVGAENLYGKDIRKWKLVCIDANGKQHSIIVRHGQMPELALVQQVAEIEFPEQMVNAHLYGKKRQGIK